MNNSADKKYEVSIVLKCAESIVHESWDSQVSVPTSPSRQETPPCKCIQTDNTHDGLKGFGHCCSLAHLGKIRWSLKQLSWLNKYW